MRRKITTAIALSLFALALVPSGLQARVATAAVHQREIQKVILRVRVAFETKDECRNLFSRYGADPRRTLHRATFLFVGDALKPLGFAAATLIRTNRTFIGAEFYQNTADVDGMATVLIHELLHQEGAGPEIDNYAENYEQISRACGTRNAAR
jgi:hypothetical protein